MTRDTKTLTLAGFDDRSDDGYEQYEREPSGYGSDGHARTERVWREHGDILWSALAVHHEPTGVVTHYVETWRVSVPEAIAWLNADAEGGRWNPPKPAFLDDADAQAARDLRDGLVDLEHSTTV